MNNTFVNLSHSSSVISLPNITREYLLSETPTAKCMDIIHIEINGFMSAMPQTASQNIILNSLIEQI